ARARLDGVAIRTPLLEYGQRGPSGAQVHLKLESLQPVGSFKARPIGNAVLVRDPAALAQGIYTASSGNSALGVAWMAARLGIAATAFVPVGAPEAKLGPLRALGARIEILPFPEWWDIIKASGRAGQEGCYIDAVRDPAAIAGDGVIGLEILEQLPDIDAIFAPFGGGGLIGGIACAVRALRPDVKIIACELETAAPLTAAFRAGGPIEVPFETGFVSGVGVGSVLPEMWPLLRDYIDGTITVPIAEVAGAIGTAARGNHVIAEGAGAISIAAAMSGRHPYKRVCAVVSGGNLDSASLARILEGGVPG
ncbi:MAG TPA: pyridoxal-phosphate dependent enzyme, partial [Sphingomonas sp.]